MDPEIKQYIEKLDKQNKVALKGYSAKVSRGGSFLSIAFACYIISCLHLGIFVGLIYMNNEILNEYGLTYTFAALALIFFIVGTIQGVMGGLDIKNSIKELNIHSTSKAKV